MGSVGEAGKQKEEGDRLVFNANNQDTKGTKQRSWFLVVLESLW